MVLYLGFLFCMPTNPKRLFLFSISGIFLTTVLNIIRCVVLTMLFYNHHELADFMHHYLFKMMIYAVNFYLWVLYSKDSQLLKN
jgi:exosortase/archaeosortase family protein